MVYDLTRLANSEIKRAVSTSRLRSISSPGTCQCFRLSTGSVSSSEGLDQNGRSGMFIGEGYPRDNLLGRSTKQTDILQGQSISIANRQGLRLFVYPYTRQLIPDNGDSAEAKDISMVVRVTNNNKTLYTALREKLSKLTAARAVNYLNYSFDAGFEEIEINGIKSTPVALMSDLPGLQTVLACEVAPLSFWGGPPGKRTWYDGSLLTVLADHIMRAADAGNMALLGRFLNLTI